MDLQAEVLSYLGDDQGVLDAFNGAEQSGVLEATPRAHGSTTLLLRPACGWARRKRRASIGDGRSSWSRTSLSPKTT